MTTDYYRTDKLAELRSFRAGYRHGRDEGEQTPAECDRIMRQLGLPITANTEQCFSQGVIDGATGDPWRYLLSFAVAQSSMDSGDE